MSIVRARVTLQSQSPYSQSRFHNTPKLDKETGDDYEKRTWREKCHVTPNNHVFIPATAFKNALDEAAQFLGKKIPGNARQTYTKHFEAGVMVLDSLVLPVAKEAVVGEWIHANANGRHGSGTRVLRCFPVVPEWRGVVEYIIVDPAITESVFEEHARECGKFIGIGRWRPRNRGLYGRFTVEGIDWIAD